MTATSGTPTRNPSFRVILTATTVPVGHARAGYGQCGPVARTGQRGPVGAPTGLATS
jgi:hypothetical protein